MPIRDEITGHEVLTRQEAESFMTSLVESATEYLLQSLNADFNIRAGKVGLTDAYLGTLKGRCGFVQCFIGYALQDIDLPAKPIATHALKEYYHGHAALSLELPLEKGPEWFLIDPTFGQFCTTEKCKPNIDIPDPGYHLMGTREGERILNALLQKGFMQITPPTALAYLTSFCRGIPPFGNEYEAFEFLKNPPHHEMHYWFSRESMCNDRLHLSPL